MMDEWLRRLIVGDGETRIDSFEAADRVLNAISSVRAKEWLRTTILNVIDDRVTAVIMADHIINAVLRLAGKKTDG